MYIKTLKSKYTSININPEPITFINVGFVFEFKIVILKWNKALTMKCLLCVENRCITRTWNFGYG